VPAALPDRAGIGFVQHHEARIAEHSAREGDALALPAVIDGFTFADSVISSRQLQNHLVDTRSLCSGHDRIVIDECPSGRCSRPQFR